MKLKTFTGSLRLATISFLGIITLSSEAKAASIRFGQWNFDPVIVTPSSSYAGGTGSAAPNTLKAVAAVSANPIDPASWGAENVTTRVSLSNFFTVEAGEGENAGDTVRGFLFGNLGGSLIGAGLDIFSLTGSFNTTVVATVDAGFQTFSEADSNSGSVLALDISRKDVNSAFRKAGILTIGQQYPFNMSLIVSASKVGVYQAVSNFNNTFTADVEVEAVPEPITIMGSGLALGFGALFKTKYSRKKKSSLAKLLH